MEGLTTVLQMSMGSERRMCGVELEAVSAREGQEEGSLDRGREERGEKNWGVSLSGTCLAML